MSKAGWVLAGVLGIGSVVALVARGATKKQHHLMPFIRGLYGRVAKRFRFEAPPLIEDESVANAESDGQTIRVNPDWVAQALAEGCDNAECTSRFLVGMLAHELGHPVHRVEGYPLEAHAEEIRADVIAGKVLALEGVRPEDFARILQRMSGYGSQTHPDGQSRRLAIEHGYRAMYRA